MRFTIASFVRRMLSDDVLFSYPTMFDGTPITPMDIDNTALIAWRLALTAEQDPMCTIRLVPETVMPFAILTLSPARILSVPQRNDGRPRRIFLEITGWWQ